ncbi:MAG: RdgB/HAM1 family non-canonical purine NTP pyrophosphatase [Ruminococcus sp.]|nr:RdgB/HAM1 family non-canonical purine NTP pyrophosphatase [Ruminococcus sp.]
MKIIIASNNAGKIREYKQMLTGAGFDEVLSLKDAGITCDPEETGATFEENAAIKARALHEMTGFSALADDSGLMVDALGGEPGVYSARWLGLNDDKLKNDEILRRLEGKTGKERSARFVCAIHFIYEDGTEVTAKGVCEGEIGFEPRGENGFGYDPIFMYGDKSFAEIPADEKNAVSHRGNALRELERKLNT